MLSNTYAAFKIPNLLIYLPVDISSQNDVLVKNKQPEPVWKPDFSSSYHSKE